MTMDNDTYSALQAIEARDPDGGEVRPTEAAYAAHKAWAIGAYGQRVWETYAKGGWGRESGYHGGDAYDYDDFD